MEDWGIGGLEDWRIYLTQRRRDAEIAEGIGELRLRTGNSRGVRIGELGKITQSQITQSPNDSICGIIHTL